MVFVLTWTIHDSRSARKTPVEETPNCTSKQMLGEPFRWNGSCNPSIITLVVLGCFWCYSCIAGSRAHHCNVGLGDQVATRPCPPEFWSVAWWKALRCDLDIARWSPHASGELSWTIRRFPQNPVVYHCPNQDLHGDGSPFSSETNQCYSNVFWTEQMRNSIWLALFTYLEADTNVFIQCGPPFVMFLWLRTSMKTIDIHLLYHKPKVMNLVNGCIYSWWMYL